MQPLKKTMVQQALKPLNTSTMIEVIKTKEKQCISLVGQKRYKDLKKQFNDGKINFTGLAKNNTYSPGDKKTIFLIEEMIELEKR